MDAVIDAVGTAREQMLDTYGKWAGELPKVVKDPKQFEQWARQFATLHKVTADLGLDAPKLDVTITGTLPGSARSGTRTATRAARTRSRTPRSNGRGGAVSGPQILDYLTEHPGISAKDIAKALGASYDTVTKRITELEAGGQARRQGERANTKWFATDGGRLASPLGL